MAIESIGTSRSYLTMQLVELKGRLTEKTGQLATGKVSSTYGGLGDNRLLDLELNQKVSRISSYQETITQVNLHIKTMNVTLDRLEDLRLDAKGALDLNDFDLQNDGQTRTQATAEVLLHEAISLLNTEVAGYYLYGGTDAYENPVADVDAIMDGADGKAGIRTVVNEYISANLGADKLGRLTIPPEVTNLTAGVPTDSTITVTEDGAHDFGFKLTSATSTLSNVNITQPTGAIPDALAIEFTGQPNAGETITIEMTLPPSHSKPVKIELKADTTGEEDGTFVIGADLAETSTNLRAAILEKVQQQSNTSLKAAAAAWAGDQFFDTFNGATPMRVDGPPFETATALTSGASTTVEWYTGENTATTNARTDKKARIDDTLSVNYGARANEKGLSDVMKALATFMSADFSTDMPTTATKEEKLAQERIDKLYYGELVDRLRTAIVPANADQSGIVDIATEISIAFRTVQDTDNRHTQMKSTYNTTIDEIEGVDKELLAVEILQLQTNLEASYRASSIVFNLNLADYL